MKKNIYVYANIIIFQITHQLYTTSEIFLCTSRRKNNSDVYTRETINKI